MPLTLVTVQGTVPDAALNGLGGTVTFVPVASLTAGAAPVPVTITDTSDQLVIPPAGVTRPLSAGKFAVGLVPTDAAGLQPSGWMYQITLRLPGGLVTDPLTCLIPYSSSPVDLSSLVPALSVAQYAGYLPLAGGTMTGFPVLPGNPSAALQAAPKQYVDAETTRAQAAEAVLTAAVAGFTQGFSGQTTVTVTHNLGRKPAVTVTDTANDVCVGDVVYLSLNAVRLTFSAPFSGTAICS